MAGNLGHSPDPDKLAFVRIAEAWRRWYESEPPLWKFVSHWRWKRAWPDIREQELNRKA